MKTILVVDDEKAVCEMLDKFLSKMGYSVLTAQSGEDALSIISSERPHIALVDIKMPRMDGVETLKKIREIDKEIGIIMITAVKDEKIAKECMDLGAYDFITKPFELSYLDEVLMMKILEFETKV